jgi:hypothetical protein
VSLCQLLLAGGSLRDLLRFLVELAGARSVLLGQAGVAVGYVALLGGLGAAALSALLLQFFHPFALTLVDLAVHFGAVAIVIGLAAVSRRRTLAPA